MPPLFYDLAVILVTAGVITVIFKWMKQPLVLGYLVAGFFIGPYFPWFPAITDEVDIHVWSDIGIVFLMFALGLEFSIKKLKKVGSTGAVTALTELLLMFTIGNIVGHLLGWSQMDCIFLGCMLSISSTTIIIKSFDDLKLKQQKFTGTVTAVLVVEDLIAVLLLVVLSTVSVSKRFDGVQLAESLVKLVFFLIVWFTFGIYLIPTFLKWMRRYMTEETLCIVAVGLCFAMVVMASYAGFSTALGAFVMGAILAETIEADVIHRIITPVKNLFGAVFFVSVGTLINPQILLRYWLPIVVIASTVVVFKSLSATAGVLLSGRNLKTAMQSGFCFCQIGEFSFIIAGLGLSFHVINPDLYPVIVSVSVLTTFVTPYMIKAALPAYNALYPRIPLPIRESLERYSASASSSGHEQSIKKFLRKQLSGVLLHGSILAALAMLSASVLKPFLNTVLTDAADRPLFWGNLLGVVITLTVMAPFLWAIVVKNVSRDRIRRLLEVYNHSQVVVIPVLLLRYFVALAFVGYVLATYFHIAAGLIVILAVLAILLMLYSRRAIGFYYRIEDRFVTNFNQRQAQHSFRIPASLEKSFYMERMLMSAYSRFVGVSLEHSRLRQDFGINVVSIERAGVIYDLPDKSMMLMPLDRITVIGSEEQISAFRAVVEVEPDMLIHDHSDNELNIYRLEVKSDSPMSGIMIRQSQFQTKYRSMIIAIERGLDYMLNPPADTLFCVGDVVWFVSPQDVQLQDLNAKPLTESVIMS
ncbi:MAG: transporter, CPA2 family (2.A.37) [bacterium P3]|nr:MAG: transporter, CPA2 family (2.A.37) [bacterium P3]KWW42305.1 MAG: transporter, CPA2 family (2.A.37) [bacterium F083]